MRSRFLCIVLSATGLLACEFPRDPGDTLERVTGDTLRVGVVEAPPFVVRTDADPAGIEPDLIRTFARSIDATIVWVWGTTAEHMEALSHRDLDIVAAGLTAGTPWRRHIGLTVPYRTTAIRVAGPAGTPSVEREAVEDADVAVPPTGPTAARVRAADGRPIPTSRLAATTGLVAAPLHELQRLGFDTLGAELGRMRHVLAVPPGENRFLMALEDALMGARPGRYPGDAS